MEAPSQPACVKQDAWTGLRSPGPQGRLSQPRPCIHTGQSGDGATLLHDSRAMTGSLSPRA